MNTRRASNRLGVLAVIIASLGAVAPTVATASHTSRGSAGHAVAHPVPVTKIHRIGSARQVIEVVASSRSATAGTLWRMQKRDGKFHVVGNPISVWLGYRGLSRPRQRHEGDLTTPMGVYRFVYMFGSQKNPGLHGFHRKRLRPGVCWSGSRLHYNRWVHRSPCNGRDENLWASRYDAYRQAAVISFNYDHPVYNRGSGIFMHVQLGHPTHGCVSMDLAPLKRIFRWARPGARIAIGTRRYLTR